MLIMVADRLHFFNQLNPRFFNYGSLPVYILKGATQLIDALFFTHLSNYNGMLYVGRILSIIFDTLTIFLIYKIAKLLFNNLKIALFSSFFYAISFFPVQNSHFFTVDVFLTLFVTFLTYCLFKYLINLKKFNWKSNILLGLNFAAMMSTKFTAVIFLPIIGLFLILKANKKLTSILIFIISFLIFYFLFMPYVFLEYKKFINDILLQIKMNSDSYIFPYTLQYVGTIPYFYYLKNIFLWGLGPFISIFSFFGFSIFLYKGGKLKNKKLFIFNKYILFFIFYLFYFLIIGKSAVKFMRYMLPIYPFLVIMAGYGLYKVKSQKSKVKTFKLRFLTYILLILSIVWTVAFINIYNQKHSRITATEWILKNIPANSTIAFEHWDDRVPLFGGENYNYVEMTLYDLPDDQKKWSILNDKLKQADYIVIASNRLYVPLQKLADCQKYKVCYLKTAEYYRELFNGKLGFKKTAEFSVYPKLGNWQIKDDGADESFTVYDHPKILIFKKV
ncbi:MAG: glycosyl transferase family 39 [uncultured bacterium]|nr:MAG: glycosyl transferase family 39 [uncultured bacterium]